MLFCAYEDRSSEEPGLKLLIASFSRHNPTLPLLIHYPVADAAFRDWVARYPNVTLDTNLDLRGKGWNAKPDVLLHAFEAGHDDLVWLDSDVLVTGDVRPFLDGRGPDTLVTCEEALWGAHSDGQAKRARLWGFEVGRSVPFTLNTAVLRVTRAHLPLVEEWRRLLDTPAYVETQTLPIPSRPLHMVGDQDVLTALLCRVDFAAVSLAFILRGSGILQIFGLKAYTLRERWQNVRAGLPPFVHAQQFKPWRRGRGLPLLTAAYLDTSPYTMLAADYRDEIGGDIDWLEPARPLGRLLRTLGFGHPALAGLPIAAAVDVAFPVGKRLRRLARRLAGRVESKTPETA